jgi:hypothetical protein
MSVDINQNHDGLFEDIKLRTFKFGKSPATQLHLVPDNFATPTGIARPPFEIQWEDQERGLVACVREQEDGHLQAEVPATDANLKNAYLAVGLFGNTGEYAVVHKTVPFAEVAEGGCRGTADLGTLTAAVKELGQQIGLTCFLVI